MAGDLDLIEKNELRPLKKTKFHIWYFIIAIWGVILLQDFDFSKFRPVVISYSEFILTVVDDKVI
jgi:cell division protease FtsH